MLVMCSRLRAPSSLLLSTNAAFSHCSFWLNEVPSSLHHLLQPAEPTSTASLRGGCSVNSSSYSQRWVASSTATGAVCSIAKGAGCSTSTGAGCSTATVHNHAWSRETQPWAAGSTAAKASCSTTAVRSSPTSWHSQHRAASSTAMGASCSTTAVRSSRTLWHSDRRVASSTAMGASCSTAAGRRTITSWYSHGGFANSAPTCGGCGTGTVHNSCTSWPSQRCIASSTAIGAGCGTAAGQKPGSGAVGVGPARGPGKALALGLPGVNKVVAVASGKGGVGKSTTAVNLAVAMATKLGMKVGLLDADIHGPSLPMLMNLTNKPVVQERGARKLLLPLENYGVKCMSMGFFTKGDAPVVWRGPIVHTAINQFLMDTVWGNLDILLVDMPPGTGDAQITLGQKLPLAGAVIVSTPQELAVLDARRGAQMFGKVNVPLLGFVSNMSYYQCPHCDTRDYIFGQGGVEKAAKDLNVEVLGEIPLDISIRAKSDEGTPIVVSNPESLPAQAYFAIAEKVKARLAADDAK